MVTLLEELYLMSSNSQKTFRGKNVCNGWMKQTTRLAIGMLEWLKEKWVCFLGWSDLYRFNFTFTVDFLWLHKWIRNSSIYKFRNLGREMVTRTAIQCHRWNTDDLYWKPKSGCTKWSRYTVDGGRRVLRDIAMFLFILGFLAFFLPIFSLSHDERKICKRKLSHIHVLALSPKFIIWSHYIYQLLLSFMLAFFMSQDYSLKTWQFISYL